MDAVEATDIDRLDGYQLFGPTYSKLDDGELGHRPGRRKRRRRTRK